MTSKSRVVLQPAYVLHLKPFRDTSALVELITPQYGRVGLVARGIKKPASRLRAVVQPFSPMLISWSGKGELASLNSAEAQGKAMNMKAEALVCGLYINELMMRLTHRAEPQIELFSQYDMALRRLCEPPGVESQSIRHQQILRQFEISLLHCLGYGLVLDREAGTGIEIRGELIYDFQLENGPVAYQGPHQELYGIRVSGRTLLALARDRLQDYSAELEVYREAKRLLRFVLDRYLGAKPLFSRQLLQHQKASITPPCH